MNQNRPTNDLPIDDAWAELLSAYHDGELSAAERSEVETRLANDPAAKKWLAELGSLGALCQESVAQPRWNDFSKQVLAEAERRKTDAIDERPKVASQTEDRPLEPDGDFGLPFGRSSRAWVWAGVAAAAAIMIGYVDRPAKNTSTPVAQRSGHPGNAGSSFANADARTTPVALGLDRMRKAVPGLRVVRVELTPEGRKQFVQSLARNGFGFESNPQSNLPQELAAARQAGVQVEPLARGPLPDEQHDDQLMFVSAEAPRYSRLIRELENDKDIFRVEADPIHVDEEKGHQAELGLSQQRSSTIQSQPRTVRTVVTPKQFRVIRFRMNITPQIGAAPKLEIKPDSAQFATDNEEDNSNNKSVERGEEEALPDAVTTKRREVARSAQAKMDLAKQQEVRRQNGRVPVVFVVKMRAPKPTTIPQ